MSASRSFLGAALAALLISLAGCAFGPGEPYAVLAPTLEARFVTAPGRDAGGGWQRLSSDFQIRVTALRLETTTIALLDSGTPTQLSFNPAQPPPGYSLCHNGHCHKADGSLPTYEEVEAEISGRPIEQRVLAELPAGPLDLLAGVRMPLACEPECELGAARIARATLPITRLTLEALVRDGRETPRIAGEVPLRFHAEAMPLVTLQWNLDIPADRREAPNVALVLQLLPSAALFDGLAFDELATTAGVIDLRAPGNDAARERLLRNLADTELTAEVTRTE